MVATTIGGVMVVTIGGVTVVATIGGVMVTTIGGVMVTTTLDTKNDEIVQFPLLTLPPVTGFFDWRRITVARTLR